MTNRQTPLHSRHSPPGSLLIHAAAALLLLALPWLFPPDGHPHGAFQQFVGHFHPLAIHLPITLLLLVPALEVAGKTRPALREAAAFILPVAAWCSAATALLGILLAHGGAFDYQAVRAHMASGILLAVSALLATLLRPAWQAGRIPWLYPTALAAILLLTLSTGHLGGTITYGKGYLTQFAPSFHLRSRKAYLPVDPASVYATRIQPILNANCVSCHGPSKRKGGLQLDTYAHLMDGGKSGQEITEGHPETSILYIRITLPPSDRRFMPSQGKPPLPASDIALIETWIRQGASPLSSNSINK